LHAAEIIRKLTACVTYLAPKPASFAIHARKTAAQTRRIRRDWSYMRSRSHGESARYKSYNHLKAKIEKQISAEGSQYFRECLNLLEPVP
jgi:hypothetical protein